MCEGYVEQFDTLLPELTVTEMLMYTAELKRKRREPLAVRLDESFHTQPPCAWRFDTSDRRCPSSIQHRLHAATKPHSVLHHTHIVILNAFCVPAALCDDSAEVYTIVLARSKRRSAWTGSSTAWPCSPAATPTLAASSREAFRAARYARFAH